MIAPTGAGSFPVDEGWSDDALLSQGYLRFGPRAIRADLAERLAWEIDKRRKEAGKNQFEIPPELASVVSSPGDAFVEVLKAYGLSPAEHDAETGAVKNWRFMARARTDRPQGRRNGPPQQGGGKRPARAKGAEGKGGNRPQRGGDNRGQAKARAQERAEARKQDPDNPFAALASLLPPPPAPKPKPKKKKKPKAEKPEAVSEEAKDQTQSVQPEVTENPSPEVVPQEAADKAAESAQSSEPTEKPAE